MSTRAVAASILGAGIGLCVSGCSLGTPTLRDATGRLAPCERAHCVSSLSGDPDYFIEPLRYASSRDAARGALQRVLAEMPGMQIETVADDYVHATATTPVLRFVDDLELLLPLGEQVVHVRSSSRVGYYDFSANRARVEDLRERFSATQR